MGRKQRKEQDNRLNSHYCIKIYYNYMTNIKLYEINVNELNTSIKRQRLSDWITMQDSNICISKK